MSDVTPNTEGVTFLAGATASPFPLHLEKDESLDGWNVLQYSRLDFDQQLRRAGWSFFFLAGEITVSACGVNEKDTLARSMKRLAAATQGLKCNSFEIDQITHHSCIGISRVRISAHARHLQKGSLLLGN